ncbi:MAG TPA: M48 family metallopeptidase [Bacteroidales bacterium]|nr:M48 family metallopeptidase [Bacteroidales bacterium]
MKTTVKLIMVILLPLIIYACSTVPLTGRKQLNILPESQMLQMSFASYAEFMKSNKLSDNREAASMVSSVGKDIAAAVQRYFEENKLSDRLDGYQWEFNLIEDKTPNAFCMPGGKVVVFEGILPYTLDKNGLAVVESHEIAHAVARHGNERMSQGLIAQFGSVALNEILSEKPDETKAIFNTAYGLGAQFGVILPFSREHELEADKLGLIFMAMAGYDPETAVSFWERMSQKGSSAPPEFLSTHPSDERRINRIKAALPEAKRYYRKR